jgi:hypothetical protein
MNPLPRLPFPSLAAVLLLAGCAGAPSQLPEPPPPLLELQTTGALQIDADCPLTGGQIVRVDYAVRADGQVETPRAAGGSECLGAGLERWVASFRYAPIPETVAATLEWMPVLH